ncbi:GntR family transcriptional regulator [Frankia canadensis]|uniref:GntR family transcriptional regulator n=1 Tax=Frankia canadensis TaxID=1836972 RepID=A0A2I2KME1_9ACTN|nr:FCD domain-containing protein [Frankia canadensis]SNQ46834.1 GntR family transcriptional regulator [Frankia canadensis]SOU54124.1 GntR family transcriptional regulator [Frankia canadensis]
MAVAQVRAPKACEIVASQLRRQIVVGELLPGATLPGEAALSAQFGVSKPTLREAFRILEAEQLIQIRRGTNGGARVQVPDPAAAARYAGAILQYRRATLRDVYAVRAVLESKAAGMVAARGSAQALQRLEEILRDEEAALGQDQDVAFFDADWAFHLAVVELAGSPTLDLLIRMLYNIIGTATASSVQSRRQSGDSLQQRSRTHRSHRRLIATLREGTEAEAEEYWHRHLAAVGRFLLEDLPAETVLDLMS